MSKQQIIAFLLGWLVALFVSPSQIFGMFKGVSASRG